MNANSASVVVAKDLVLRPVCDSDYPFLRGVYREVRQAELMQTNWSQEQKNTFCDSQFALQDYHYRKHYPDAVFYVVQWQGQSVGRLYLSNGPRFLALMDIALLQAWQKQGIGSVLMQWLTQWADATQRPIRLYVEPENPARQLYVRMGFEPHALDGAYLQMWRGLPPASQDAMAT